MVNAGVEIDVVLEIDVPDNEIVKRLSGRRVHLESGRVYHIEFNPPAESGIDDVSGEPLFKGPTTKKNSKKALWRFIMSKHSRWLVFMKVSKGGSGPNVIKIDGVESVDKIREAISAVLA